MEQYKVLLFVICTLITPISYAIDSEKSYNQSTLAYFQLDPNQQNEVNLDASILVSKNLFLIASIDNYSINTSPTTNRKLASQSAGAGYRYQLNANLDLNASIVYQKFEKQNSSMASKNTRHNTNNVQLEAGTRINVSPVFQVYSALVYRLPEQTLAQQVGVKLSSEYYFNRYLSAGLHAQIISANNVYGVQGSFHF